MAMRLAHDLGKKASIQSLVTIDPIGPQCGWTGVIFGSSDCHRAPRDPDWVKVRQGVGSWWNFYQTDDTWLTSSAIAEAKNARIDFWGPHSQIDTHPAVWKPIEAEMEAPLSPAKSIPTSRLALSLKKCPNSCQYMSRSTPGACCPAPTKRIFLGEEGSRYPWS